MFKKWRKSRKDAKHIEKYGHPFKVHDYFSLERANVPKEFLHLVLSFVYTCPEAFEYRPDVDKFELKREFYGHWNDKKKAEKAVFEGVLTGISVDKPAARYTKSSFYVHFPRDVVRNDYCIGPDVYDVHSYLVSQHPEAKTDALTTAFAKGVIKYVEQNPLSEMRLPCLK